MRGHGLFKIDFFLTFKKYVEFVKILFIYLFIFFLLHIFSQNHCDILWKAGWGNRVVVSY